MTSPRCDAGGLGAFFLPACDTPGSCLHAICDIRVWMRDAVGPGGLHEKRADVELLVAQIVGGVAAADLDVGPATAVEPLAAEVE